jgi:hypothetical protein
MENPMTSSPAAPRLDLIDLDNLTLGRGSHDAPWCTDEDCGEQPPAGWTPPTIFEACEMELTAYVAGEGWSDSPECVSPVIAAFVRSWNDGLPDGDRQQLKRWTVPMIGTNTGPEDDDIRAWMACDWLVRVQTPAWLRLAELTDQADLLAGMPELRPDTVPTIRPALEAARSDAHAARDAAWAAAGAAAGAAARAAAWERLAPTVAELQSSAHSLIERMIAAGKAA